MFTFILFLFPAHTCAYCSISSVYLRKLTKTLDSWLKSLLQEWPGWTHDLYVVSTLLYCLSYRNTTRHTRTDTVLINLFLSVSVACGFGQKLKWRVLLKVKVSGFTNVFCEHRDCGCCSLFCWCFKYCWFKQSCGYLCNAAIFFAFHHIFVFMMKWEPK